MADVVETRDRLGQRFGEVRELGLKTADPFAAFAGQLRRIGLVVGHRVVDEDRDGPVFALRIEVAEPSVERRDDGHRLALRVAAFGRDAAADVFRDLADVLHHGRYVGENRLVLAL